MGFPVEGDGLLIGGASLKIDDFNEVVRLCTISSCSRTQ